MRSCAINELLVKLGLFYARGRFVAAAFHWSGCHGSANKFHLASLLFRDFILGLRYRLASTLPIFEDGIYYWNQD